METFIEDAVDEAMSSIASPSFHKEELSDVFIRALQTDSSWVGYYCNTGELDVPSLPSKDGEFGEVLTTANEVCQSFLAMLVILEHAAADSETRQTARRGQ